jgi:hypothetical protein
MANVVVEVFDPVCAHEMLGAYLFREFAVTVKVPLNPPALVTLICDPTGNW